VEVLIAKHNALEFESRQCSRPVKSAFDGQLLVGLPVNESLCNPPHFANSFTIFQEICQFILFQEFSPVEQIRIKEWLHASALLVPSGWWN
jgi:hypothetical protein